MRLLAVFALPLSGSQLNTVRTTPLWGAPGQIYRGEGPESKRQADTVEKLLQDNQRLRDENKQLRASTSKMNQPPPATQLVPPSGVLAATRLEPALPGEAARRFFTSEGTLPSLSSDVSLNELVYRLGFPDLNQDVGGDPFDVQPYHDLLEDLSLEDEMEEQEACPNRLLLHISEHLQAIAPSVDALLGLVFSQLGWLFVPVRQRHISREHAMLWQNGRLQLGSLSLLLSTQAASLSLYCGLLSVATLYLRSEHIGYHMDTSHKLKQARTWQVFAHGGSCPSLRARHGSQSACTPLSRFNFSLRLLEQSQFMSGQPDVKAMLTFCVLTCLFQTFGQAAYHDNLQAVMLRTALALRFHRLAQSPRDPAKWTPEEEDRRRIWTYLGCREGMFLAPGVCVLRSDYQCAHQADCAAFDPRALCSRFGLQAFDTTVCPHLLHVRAEDFRNYGNCTLPPEQPLSVPTEVSFLIAQSRLAWLFNGYRGKLQHTTSRAEAYDLTLEFDKKLQTLHDDQPYFALPTSVGFLRDRDNATGPTWLPAARHVFTLNILQKRLLLHRRFFALSLREPAHAASREISTDTALAMLSENRCFSFPFDDVLDTLHNTLTAAIVLLVDLLHPDTSTSTTSPTSQGSSPRPVSPSQRLQEIEELLSTLSSQAAGRSKQLTKASALLNKLLLRYRQSNQLLPLEPGFPLPWQHSEDPYTPSQDMGLWVPSPGVSASSVGGSMDSTSPTADEATINWLANLQDWLQLP